MHIAYHLQIIIIFTKEIIFQMKIREKIKVGVAGAGGIGSNCAAMLVRSGITRLVLADFDTVSTSNLNRQFYFADQVGMPKVEALMDNLSRICPEVEIDANVCRITPENAASLFAECDIIVEALDDAAEKQWLIEFFSDHFPEKPIVCGSGMAGTGSFESLHIQKSGNIHVCGDQATAATDHCPPLAPRVNIVAAMQADTVLCIIKSNQSNNSNE